MSAWSLLFVPASLGMIVLLLVAISWIEQRVLAPRGTIVPAALSGEAEHQPENVETFMADPPRGLLAGLTLSTATEATGLVEVAVETRQVTSRTIGITPGR